MLALALGGFSTTKVEPDKIGPIAIEREHTETYPIRPVISYAAIGIGLVLVVVGAISSKRV